MIEKEYNIKGRASNERFCEIAGVFPQKRYREFATAYPAATSVNPATSQSRVGVSGNFSGQRSCRWIESGICLATLKKKQGELKIEFFLLSLQS